MEEIGLWVGFFLTLMVYSYLIRDNFFYRLAVYCFVGMTAAYVVIITTESVLIPWFDSTVATGDPGNLGLGLIPVLLGLLMVLKTSHRLARWGNLGIAIVVGVGAGVALVGALTGTLIPLAVATMREGEGNILNAILIFIGVSSSLIYFQYLARRLPDDTTERPRAVELISVVGQGFIVVTLGALYASAILTSLTIFTERIGFIVGQF